MKFFKGLMEFLKSFFCSGGKWQPVYFWITCLMIMVITMMIMSIRDKLPTSDTVFVAVLGFVGGWIALYNYDKRNSGGGQQ